MIEKRLSGLSSSLAGGVQVLSESDLDQIHAASLQILATVGIEIDHPAMLEMLQSNGATVDGRLVKMPGSLVERCIDSSPGQVTLHARDASKNVYLGEGSVHFTNDFGATWVEDINANTIREATLEDLATYTRLADALDYAHFVLFSVVPQDVKPSLLDVECTAVTLQNTTKHVQLSLETADWLDEIIAIGKIISGPGNPLPFSAGGVPNSPLQYPHDTIEKFITLARNQVPCFIVVGAMAGATAPVTLAGTLALQNAEVLAGVVTHQLAEPGAPVVYGTFCGGFDMRATKLALGGPEIPLIAAATQQLSNRYGIPLGYATGGVTDNLSLDVQAGFEKANTALFAALAGVDVIHDGAAGLMGAGMLTSLRGMVLADDNCRSIDFLLNGISVDRDTIAMDVIRAVGQGGTYLDQIHTVKNFRKALHASKLQKRNADLPESPQPVSYMLDAAHEKAMTLVRSHQPVPLTDEQIAQIESVREAAQKKTAA